MSVEDIEPYLQQLIDNQTTTHGLIASMASRLGSIEDQVIDLQQQLLIMETQVSDLQKILVVLLVGTGILVGVLAFSQFWRQVWK